MPIVPSRRARTAEPELHHRGRCGALYFLGRPYAMYARHYDVPVRAGRPCPRRPPRAVVG